MAKEQYEIGCKSYNAIKDKLEHLTRAGNGAITHEVNRLRLLIETHKKHYEDHPDHYRVAIIFREYVRTAEIFLEKQAILSLKASDE